MLSARYQTGDQKGGVACVPSKVMKRRIGLLLKPLYYTFNMSLTHEIFPLMWKKAVYDPIRKRYIFLSTRTSETEAWFTIIDQ